MLLTAALGAFLATMDTSLVSVALPLAAQAFQSSLPRISWVMVAYLLASASLQIPCGRLSDLLAPGRLFLLGVALFAGASGLAGLSPSLGWLLAARVLQGAGAALMLGVSPKIITLAFGVGERGLALGLFSAGFATGVTLGAPLGGLLLTYLSWRWVFLVNLFLGLAVVAVGRRPLAGLRHELSSWDWRALDPLGSFFLTATVMLFVLTLTGLRDYGLKNAGSLAALALTSCSLALLFLAERRQPLPLLHRELWLSRPFLLGSGGVMLAFATVMGCFFLLPFLLGQIYGYSPGGIGLLLASLSLSNALASFLGGFLADRLGNLVILRTGLGLIAAGLLSLAHTTLLTSTPALAGRLALMGMGLGLFSAPNLNEILQGVKPSLIGLAASTNAVLKNLGSLLGVVVLVTAFSLAQAREGSPSLDASRLITCFHRAFWLAAALAALNFLLNLLPRGTDRKQGGGAA